MTDTLYYPGDSYAVPTGRAVPLLAAPVGAPWLKIGEAMDFVLAVRPARAFGTHDLESWEFDVLSALRRAGAPYELTPGQLVRQTLVTSGTMTNRVDRLTARGLVERLPDPRDRRGVLVRLTADGKAAVDGAFEALLAAEADLLADLSDRDRTQLAGLLRSLLAPFS